VRTVKGLFIDIIHKPPLLFPLVALFHLFMLIYSTWIVHTEPFPSIRYLQPLWLFAYTICWIFVCDMRRLAALGYIMVTILNIILLVTIKSRDMKELYTASLFPMDILFSFFVLFYYKRFD
jgi:hypothetical protein